MSSDFLTLCISFLSYALPNPIKPTPSSWIGTSQMFDSKSRLMADLESPFTFVQTPIEITSWRKREEKGMKDALLNYATGWRKWGKQKGGRGEGDVIDREEKDGGRVENGVRKWERQMWGRTEGQTEKEWRIKIDRWWYEEDIERALQGCKRCVKKQDKWEQQGQERDEQD